jgi:hypothetical protein
MSKAVRAAAVVLVASLAACSGGKGQTEAPTTTTTAPTTTRPTPTTLAEEDQVKAAYLAYWQTADQLFEAPGSPDTALIQRAAEPLLSAVRDDLATSAAQGSTIHVPTGATNSHSVGAVRTSTPGASLSDCWVDGRVEFANDGSIIDGQTFTKAVTATLINVDGTWKVNEIRIDRKSEGVTACGG